MKRGSSLVYICTSTPTETSYQRRPNFKFNENCLPKLVDYSFSEDSDSGNDSSYTLDESWDRLQRSLDSLSISFGSMDTSRTPLNNIGFNRHLHERASLKLKAEQHNEEVRKVKLIGQLNGSICAQTSTVNVRKQLSGVFGASKSSLSHKNASKTSGTSMNSYVRMRREVKSLPTLDLQSSPIDTSVRVCEAERPAKKRRIDLNVFSKLATKRFSFKLKKKEKKSQNEIDTPKRNCLFSCFKMSGSYAVKM